MLASEFEPGDLVLIDELDNAIRLTLRERHSPEPAAETGENELPPCSITEQ
jgi:hypothetical protein